MGYQSGVSFGTTGDTPRDVARKQTGQENRERKKERHLQDRKTLEPKKPEQKTRAISPDAQIDWVSPTRPVESDRSHTRSEGFGNPQRRLTEAELREVLAEKEREITKRQRLAEEKKRALPQLHEIESSNIPPPEAANETGIPADRHDCETRPQPTERRRLTEEELRQLLSQGVQELTDAEKRRQRDGPAPKPNLDQDFGFD